MKRSSGLSKAAIFELKWASGIKEFEKKRDEVLKQIIDGKHAEELENAATMLLNTASNSTRKAVKLEIWIENNDFELFSLKNN